MPTASVSLGKQCGVVYFSVSSEEAADRTAQRGLGAIVFSESLRSARHFQRSAVDKKEKVPRSPVRSQFRIKVTVKMPKGRN